MSVNQFGDGAVWFRAVVLVAVMVASTAAEGRLALGQVNYGGAEAPPANPHYIPGRGGYYVHQSSGEQVRLRGHAVDEGIINGYSLEAFRPEPRDLFWQMDKVAGPDGHLVPLDFDLSQDRDQQAVYGRNTWILWCAGNEGFWNWLAQYGYGFLDFLHIIDSRQRGRRFRDLGLINQPGMKGSDVPGPWGLYLDTVDEELQPPPGAAAYSDQDDSRYATASYNSRPDPQGRSLTSDGVDPLVYGYPSGVVGMRLFPNPFFDAQAQQRWNAEAFYNDPNYARNPEIVRPFRVGISCGFCHVAPHPLIPPDDPEAPQWENLSSIIGNQYFRTSAITGSRADRGNFIWHVLALAQPGTIDPSLISTDHINNPNTMNAVFQLPARLQRANENPAEEQGEPATRIPPPIDSSVPVRRVPHVLLDGSDSVGAWGALARVYLNIGTFYEEWNECHNPVLGFTHQKPFRIDICQTNSFYWQVNEAYRVNALQHFFLWQKDAAAWQSTTAPMKLVNAADVTDEQRRQLDPAENPQIAEGRRVFARNCMICHSSKQPTGFSLAFALAHDGRSWDQQERQRSSELILPLMGEDWEDFKKSPSYLAYLADAEPLADRADFLDDNFLSTDIRIPISLVGTNAGRPLGRNALEGWVWSDFSSDTYKQLPAVGKIAYHDPFASKTQSFQPPGDGPGYARPATLVSVWATAPLLHNNALGKYIADHDAAYRVSTAGRVEMFEDAIEKLLWPAKRSATPSGEGGLRGDTDATWQGADPGWVFRTDMETSVVLPRGHLRQAVELTAPAPVVWVIDRPWFIPLLLAIGFLAAAWWDNRWVVFAGCVFLGLALFALLVITGLRHVAPWWVWAMTIGLAATGIASMAGGRLRSVGDSRSAAGIEDINRRTAHRQRPYARVLDVGPRAVRIAAAMLLAVSLFALWQAGSLVRNKIDGKQGDLIVGPIPKGVPVNALASIDPEASPSDLLAALRGMLSFTAQVSQLPRNERYDAEALRLFNLHAGPALMQVSSCPDMVLDRGHLFGESLSDPEKRALVAFLKTL